MSRSSAARHFPARIILLDAGPPFKIVAGRLICDALENVLCMASSLAGLQKVPLFGIYVLTTYPEIVLPLTPVKGNFTRLYKALLDVRTLLEESSNSRRNKTDGHCLPAGIMESCRQFQRYIANAHQSSLNFNQLEIVVLTAQKGDFVQQSLKNLPNEVDLTFIKRILSITIERSLTDSASANSQDVPLDGSGDEFTALVDVMTLECDEKVIQRFFYNWLSETMSETEHLHLLLPPPTPADSDLLIKCDILEKMINPCQLRCHSRFALESDASLCKHIYQRDAMIPIHQLKTVRAFPRSQLCDSVLFGIPLVVVSTTCWTIDWEDLDQNQSNFNALCEELIKKDQVLLLQMLDESSLTSGSTGATSNMKSTVVASGYFIVMPADKNLLIKSVIPEELFLPSNRQQSVKQISLESELRIQSSLSQLGTCDHFSPLDHSAGLFSAMKCLSLPKSTLQKEWNQNRKTFLRKMNQTATTSKPTVPSPPKYPKPMMQSSTKPMMQSSTRHPANVWSMESANKHTATVWSNPLTNVVKKAPKPTNQRESAVRQTGVKSNSMSKMSWKSGFVED